MRLRAWIVSLTILSFGSAAWADFPLNDYGRWLGWGYSDGYHSRENCERCDLANVQHPAIKQAVTRPVARVTSTLKPVPRMGTPACESAPPIGPEPTPAAPTNSVSPPPSVTRAVPKPLPSVVVNPEVTAASKRTEEPRLASKPSMSATPLKLVPPVARPIITPPAVGKPTAELPEVADDITPIEPEDVSIEQSPPTSRLPDVIDGGEFTEHLPPID